MSIKIEHKLYQKNKQHAFIYRQISLDVERVLKHKAGFKKLLILKFASYCSLLILLYWSIIQSTSFLSLALSYTGFGLILILTGLNFAHDLAHNAIFKDRRINNGLFEFLFLLLGANGYLWKIRHTHSHHLYPNVENFDADLEIGKFIKIDPVTAHQKYHKYQYLYAPFLYTIYTFYWIFYKDFIHLIKNKNANLTFPKHPKREWIKFFAFKLLYLLYILTLPLLLSPLGWSSVVIAFCVMHLVKSWFLLITFLITHHVEKTQFAVIENTSISNSWFMHQIQSANDFHPFSKLANFIFGGFNCHVAHHLFPNICHIHYPEISRIIYGRFKENEIIPNNSGYFKSIQSHFRLLKQYGKS